MHKFYNTKKSESLASYISINFNSKADFALHQKVLPQQVTQWLEKDFIVIDDVLYSFRRKLNRRAI